MQDKSTAGTISWGRNRKGKPGVVENLKAGTSVALWLFLFLGGRWTRIHAFVTRFISWLLQQLTV